MKKKYKRALAAALAAVMIWNTCDWHPQALAGSSVQYIEEVKELSDEILHQEVPYGTKYKDLELPDKLKVRVLAEEAPDEEDSAEDKDGAEKIATPSELQSGDGEVETEKRSQTLSSSETDGTVRKASPSEADVIEKSEIGEDDTEQKASPSDADGTKTDKNWKEVKVRWVLDETFSEKDTYDGKTPGIYVFDAELKSSRYELDTGFLPRIEVTVLPEEKGPAIIGFSELDETIAVQKLPLGAKESDIVLPDTLEVEVEEADETLAEDSQNVHLVKAVDKGTEKDTDAETAVWQISGITWKLDEEQSDLSEFHGGISEKDYFEEFDENGEPVETSTKTWAGYAEENQDYNGRVYVYRAVLPEDLGKFEVADTADLPEIDVMVGDASVSLLAYAVRAVWGIDLPETAVLPGGKPYFPACPQAHFSVSHTRTAVLVAVSAAPVGADVEQVRPLLLARQNCTLHSITLRVLGGESDIEYRVRHLLENANPTAAIYCKTGECEIRITARAETDSSAEKMCRAYATKFYDLLGDAVYDEDVTGLEETLVHTLKKKGLTIATAESCTGGMIAQRLTNVSGASEVFGFGFVTYWEQAKAKMIGVDPAAIAKYNVVSAPVAAQMALGAAEAAGADIAVSVTGLAGPNGGDAVRPVGTVYLGAACGETVYVKKLFVSRPDRALVRARAAQAALELALRLAQGKVPADTQALAKSARHDAAALTALDSTFLKG